MRGSYLHLISKTALHITLLSYNVLAVCFLLGFSTNDSIIYVLVVYFLQTFLRCVEIKVFNFEVKAKERLVGSVEVQSEIMRTQVERVARTKQSYVNFLLV